AVLLELPDADLALLQELVGEQHLVVRLRNRDRRNQDRRRGLARLLGRTYVLTGIAIRVDPGDVLSLEELHCSLRGGGGLERDLLVDGHRLPAGDDVLHASRRCVLPAERDRLQALLLERGDDGAG